MKFILSALILLSFISCDSQIKGILKKGGIPTTGTTKSGTPLSNEEVIRGLKEALTVGTNNSSSLAGKLDGFYKNPRLFIPWPAEAEKMKERLLALGFEKQISE